MAVIHVLSEHLVNQIAAGEVIERPASVVKELLENAVDAQAARLVLELEEAGKKLIRLSDDGAGLAPDDVPLALVGHATSKIASADDLEGITTLGFRGEALASIASVADVRLVSRTADALEATEVSASGGKVEAARPTSGPVGTTVEVRNLFRYVPARRKFLKTDATEMGHITEQAARMALAYPAVHLTVTHNGRSVYELAPTDSVRERVAAFLGADVAEPLVEVASEEPAGRLWGLVGPPHLARATTAAQYLFINGRFVRDRGLLHALREAYRGLLEGYRQPVAFLFLTVPPERVDVNVHPTKIEVRLRDAHLLYGQVLGTIREKLLGSVHAPRLAAPGPADGVAGGTVPGGGPAGAGGAATARDAAGREERIRQAMADFLRSPPSTAQQRLPLGGRDQGAPSPGEQAWPVAQGGSPGGGAMASGAADAPPAPSPAQGLPQAAAGAGRAAETGRAEGAADLAGAAPLPPGHAIQIHNTYLVAETADGILIVDQHALHERVLFEEIMRRLEAGPLESQRRLVPVAVSLSDGEMAAVEEHREALAYLGIDAAPLGPRDVGIQAFPMLLERADPEATLRDFLAWALSVDAPPSPRQVLERLAHVAACRAAVKAGDALKTEEIEALLAHREAAGLAPTCPHGRPTALVLRREDLEKQFGRDYAAGGRKPVGDEALPF